MRRLGVTSGVLAVRAGSVGDVRLAAPQPGWWRRLWKTTLRAVPPDYNEKTEFYWARLQYPEFGAGGSARRRLRVGPLLDHGLPQE